MIYEALAIADFEDVLNDCLQAYVLLSLHLERWERVAVIREQTQETFWL